MDPIIEEDEPIEITPSPQADLQLQIPPRFNPTSRQTSPASSTDSTASSSSLVVIEREEIQPILKETPKKRLFDRYTFTPSQQIPRDFYRFTEDKPSAVRWPPKEAAQCNYVLCFPEINEQYTASHQTRPGFLTKAQSTSGLEVESELLKLTSKRDPNSKPPDPLRSVSLRTTDPPISSASSMTENESTRSASPVLETSRKPLSRKTVDRSKHVPIENSPGQRVSLIPSGLKVLPKWGGQTETPNSGLILKPYETRMCNGCDRYITLTKTQYVCNDIGCKNRLCDRCYNIWLDAKWEGREIVTPEKLRMAHTAAEIREKYAKGMLQNPNISLEEKAKYIGEGAAVAANHSFIDDYSLQEHNIGHKTDPSRYINLDLNSLKDVFGKEEVEMTLLDSAVTKESSITSKVGPERSRPASPHVESLSTNDSDSFWGWDYAINKRDAAATGRTAPALPQLDYQPPTHASPVALTPSLSTSSSSSLTIISMSETVIGRADIETSQRSSSPSWTIWTLESSDSLNY
ncbi:hypothetical protein TWF718_008602 [Orbilia javanica]|uniref:Uncharacterized protein n=1 Tax=Orbilia javanica TaxID=47235 RepID=A0AAN8ML34_9PEZI